MFYDDDADFLGDDQYDRQAASGLGTRAWGEDPLDVDLGELEFDAHLDVYMYGEDGSGGQAYADRIAAWDDFHDGLQDDPLNMSGSDVARDGMGPMDIQSFMESDRDTERRLAAASMDSDDRA